MRAVTRAKVKVTALVLTCVCSPSPGQKVVELEAHLSTSRCVPLLFLSRPISSSLSLPPSSLPLALYLLLLPLSALLHSAVNNQNFLLLFPLFVSNFFFHFYMSVSLLSFKKL